MDHNLSESELEYLQAILSEVGSTGRSDTLDNMWMVDYEEKPVNIVEFMTNDRYLGRSLKDDAGNLTVYNYWVEVLTKIFEEGSNIYECVAGSEKIPLLDGTTITMEELHRRVQNREYIELYSFDRDSHKVVPGVVSNSVCNGERDIYEIHLSNGKSFRCTSNHKILTRGNIFRSIDNGLEVGTSLMPFNKFINDSGYERVKNKDIEALEIVRENGRKGAISRWSDEEQVVKASERMIRRNQDPNYQLSAMRGKILKPINRLLADGKELNPDNYHKYKSSRAPRWDKAIEYFESIDDMIKCAIDYNTHIVSIEYVGKELVYDIEVPNYHNFAVDAGIFVHNCALSGAIGIGKTTTAVIGLTYILYRLLCLRDPATYYNLNRGSNIAIAFFNVSIDQSYGVGYSRFQSYCKRSEWFLENGKVLGVKYPTYYPNKGIEILVGSKREHFLGRDIFAGLLDEMDFAKGQDQDFEKSNILKLYNTVKRRIESRFMNRGVLPGVLFLVSSKNSEHDFLEQYIGRNKSNPNLLIVDEPIWVIKKDLGIYSGETFNLAVGDRYSPSRILDDDEEVEAIKNSGRRVLEVPVEHRDAFELDMNTAIADIAGIAIVSSSKFFVVEKVLKCYKPYLKNPFKMDEISLGFDDSSEITDYLLEELLPKLDRGRGYHIHWDTSKNHDRTGLAMTTTTTSKVVKRLVRGNVGEVTDIVHKVVFAVGIRAMPGEEIPYYKIRNFIYHIRSLGFNIESVTCDGYQSLDTIQQFKLQGLNSYVLSVDRNRGPYDIARNAVNEGRLIMPKIQILEDEFLDVEDNKMRGKIDHTSTGSKDILDAVVANIYKVSQSYAPNIKGSNINDVLDVNLAATLGDLDDDWILPSGVTVINPR